MVTSLSAMAHGPTWTRGEVTLLESAQPVLRPGAPLAVATQRGGRQLDVFAVGNDGAVWVTFTVDDGPWTDGIGGRTPFRVSPAGFAPPGAPLAVATQRGGHQLDVFAVGNDGAVWVTFTVDDGPWTDGIGGRTPFRVSPAGFAPPGAPLAVATQRGGLPTGCLCGGERRRRVGHLHR